MEASLVGRVSNEMEFFALAVMMQRSRRYVGRWGRFSTRWTRILGILAFVGFNHVSAWGESPAPSVHWGSLSFPDQYSTVVAGLTLNRFTPTDGYGSRYDSTISNTIGLNWRKFDARSAAGMEFHLGNFSCAGLFSAVRMMRGVTSPAPGKLSTWRCLLPPQCR